MKSTGWRKLMTLGSGLLLALGAAACDKSEASREGAADPTSATKGGETAAPGPGETATPVEKETPGTAEAEGRGETGTAEAETGTAEAGEVAGQGDPAPGEAVAASETTLEGDGSYTIKIRAPDRVAKGGSGTVTVTVTPGNGWHMNQKFPTKLTVTPPGGVEVEKDKLRAADAVSFDENKGVFAVKFKATEAGDKAFAGEFKFAVCTDATCDPKKAKLAWNVAVK